VRPRKEEMAAAVARPQMARRHPPLRGEASLLKIGIDRCGEKISIYFDFVIIAFNVEVCWAPVARKIRQERKIYPFRSKGDMVPARRAQVDE